MEVAYPKTRSAMQESSSHDWRRTYDKTGRRVVIDEETISTAAEALLAAAPGAEVILFGSFARGQGGPKSDLDFLVVEPKVRARRAEMVRLNDVLRRIGIHADILVVSADHFREWANFPGTVFHEAAREGRVFRASA